MIQACEAECKVQGLRIGIESYQGRGRGQDDIISSRTSPPPHPQLVRQVLVLRILPI